MDWVVKAEAGPGKLGNPNWASVSGVQVIDLIDQLVGFARSIESNRVKVIGNRIDLQIIVGVGISVSFLNSVHELS